MARVQFLAGHGDLFFSTAFKPVLGPTQLLIQWVSLALSSGIMRMGCEIDHSPPYLHLVLRSRMVELYLYSPMCFHGVGLN
jgi:hypothetical protein